VALYTVLDRFYFRVRLFPFRHLAAIMYIYVSKNFFILYNEKYEINKIFFIEILCLLMLLLVQYY